MEEFRWRKSYIINKKSLQQNCEYGKKSEGMEIIQDGHYYGRFKELCAE